MDGVNRCLCPYLRVLICTRHGDSVDSVGLVNSGGDAASEVSPFISAAASSDRGRITCPQDVDAEEQKGGHPTRHDVDAESADDSRSPV